MNQKVNQDEYDKELDLHIQDLPTQASPQKYSEYSLQYTQFFQELTDPEPQLDTVIQRLASHSIRYIPSSPHQTQPSLSIESKSKKSEIVIFTMKWGKFTQRISVINFMGPNPIISQFEGRYHRKTITYERGYGEKEIVFKSQIFDTCNRSLTILSVLKEVFIGKIASALEFGPICCHETSFDILLYENSIGFCMERCIGYKERSFKRLNTDPLRSGMRLMHSLQMVHFDIKPDNIMFSEGLGKLVTIDFNLSEIIEIVIGKKMSIPFRGSINFCHPEMAQNFMLTDSFNFVDPYYNDVHCLKESFLFISQQPVEDSQEQSTENPQEKDQQWFLVLKLKQLLFIENWKKASDILTIYQKKLAHKLKEVMQFMYELHASERLSQFYNTFIPAHERDTLFMRDFNCQISKRQMTKIGIQYPLSEKEKEFWNRLMIENLEEKAIRQIADRRQCRQFLESQKKFMNERTLYFNVFLDYVSYHHNQYRVDARERNEVANIFHQFIKIHVVQLNLQEKQSHFLSHKANEEMEGSIRFILRQTIRDLQSPRKLKGNPSTQKTMILRQTIRKLLFFIFILDIGSLNENILWFDQIIQSFTDPKDKYAVLFSLKHLNILNAQGISQELYNFIHSNANNLGLRLMNDQTLISHSWLKEQLAIQRVLVFIDYNLYDLNSMYHAQQAFSRIGKGGFSQFRPVYFSIYEHIRSFGDVKFSKPYYKTFSQNLNDPILQKQFSIYYHHQQLSPINSQTLEGLIDNVREHIFKVERQDVYLQISFFDFIDKLMNLADFYSMCLPRQIYLKLVQKLKLINGRLDELVAYYNKVKKSLLSSFKGHVCFLAADNFPIYIHQIKKCRSIQECQDFLRDGEEMEYYKNCKRCRFALCIVRLSCLNGWVLNNQPQDSYQIIGKLNGYYKYVCKLSADPESQQYMKTFDGVQMQVYMNNLIFAIFIWKNDHSYRTLGAFYQIIRHKKNNLNQQYTWIYFSLNNIMSQIQIIQGTLMGLFHNDSPKCLEFLEMLTIYFEKNRTEDNYNIILRSFQRFLMELSERNRLELYQLLKRGVKDMLEGGAFRIYFYVLAQSIKESSLQRSAFAFIARSIEGIPYDFQDYYSSEIHRHFVKELRRQGRPYTRKEAYLNNKLVKLFIRLGRQPIDRKKYSKFHSAKDKELIRKIEKVRGCFYIQKEENIIFSFQMKRRLKAF